VCVRACVCEVCVCMHMCVYLRYLRVLSMTVVMPNACIQNMGADSLSERGLLYLSWTILICFTMLQVMFPMRGSISNKQDISSSRSSISTADSPANSKLLALQEKCYHELMDVCRCIADSLGVNSSSIMNVQVKSLIQSAFSWFLPMQSLFIPEFSCL